jgi:sterol-4alpha-carboxylate 3-dehydrogenase (decarboxylating)
MLTSATSEPHSSTAIMAFVHSSILVTGGSGQVGIAIVKELQKQSPTASITVLDLVKPEVGDGRFMEKVTYFAGNITDESFLNKVMDAVKPLVVFHTAGLIPQMAELLHMETEEDYTAINVKGTKIVFEAAQAVGTVQAFVFTSSADVVKGSCRQDLVNVNETMPIPAVFDSHYAQSKVLQYFLSSKLPCHPCFFSILACDFLVIFVSTALAFFYIGL